MITCYILDDQYGKEIYEGMKKRFPQWNFPIKTNILNPLSYIDQIEKTNPDYILLDNYFPNRSSGWEEPLGAYLLEEIINRDIKTKVVCISDYREKLVDRYEPRQQAVLSHLVKGFAGKDVRSAIELCS